MMMQTKPVERQVSTRRIRMGVRTVVRGVAVAMAACVFAPLVAQAAYAETIAHSRPHARQTLVVQTERAKTSGRSSKSGMSKSASRHTAAKQAHAAPEARARLRSRRHPEPAYEPEPVLMHRAKAKRGHATEAVRVIARSAPRALRTPMAPADDVASTSDSAKTLTVDDFMRAASGSAEVTPATNGKTYVRGESRTEVDDRIFDEPAAPAPKPRPLALKPVVRKPAAVVATVEAAPAGAATASFAADAPPEDLAGEPIVASADAPEVSTTRHVAKSAIASLPLLSRQEVTEEVEQPVVLPGLYRNGRLVVPAPLKGTHEILVHQNLMADDEGLERIEDDYDLHRLRAAHLLVDFPESASLHINPELAADRRCGRVWSVRFATNIARDFYARFHQPLEVNSAVRTVAFQVRLQRTNGNAAGIDGDTASPHLTGQAMDLGKRGMSMAQIAWMRAYLLPLMQAGKVDVEEEFQQACFHISVYRTYMPATRRAPRTQVAQLHEPRVKSTSRSDDLR